MLVQSGDDREVMFVGHWGLWSLETDNEQNIWSITFSSPFCCKVTSMWAFRVGSYVICFDLHIFQFLAGFEFDYVLTGPSWSTSRHREQSHQLNHPLVIPTFSFLNISNDEMQRSLFMRLQYFSISFVWILGP
jgi:hypothetical protein